jgi:hypothetical protein
VYVTCSVVGEGRRGGSLLLMGHDVNKAGEQERYKLSELWE